MARMPLGDGAEIAREDAHEAAFHGLQLGGQIAEVDRLLVLARDLVLGPARRAA